jgi:hypothetical protein
VSSIELKTIDDRRSKHALQHNWQNILNWLALLATFHNKVCSLISKRFVLFKNFVVLFVFSVVQRHKVRHVHCCSTIKAVRLMNKENWSTPNDKCDAQHSNSVLPFFADTLHNRCRLWQIKKWPKRKDAKRQRLERENYSPPMLERFIISNQLM